MTLAGRPHYETPADLEAEQQIADAIVECWGLTGAQKLSEISYVLDRALYKGRDIICFAEIKARGWTFGAGEGLFLSLFKTMRGRDLEQATGLPAVLVVQFPDSIIRWGRLADYIEGRVIRWGRTDRGDAGDIEPAVIFPWSAFKKLDEARPDRPAPQPRRNAPVLDDDFGSGYRNFGEDAYADWGVQH